MRIHKEKNIMIQFEEHDGMIFRMLEEPVPLTPEATFPCVVTRREDGDIGRYTKRHCSGLIGEQLVVKEIIDGKVVFEDAIWTLCELPYLYFEIIGYPVEEGSAEWALYQMMQGHGMHRPCMGADDWWEFRCDKLLHYDNCPLPRIITTVDWFLINFSACKDWQLYKEPKPDKEPIADCDNCKHRCTNSNIDHCQMYEPKPEPAKEPEIVAHKQHANCLMCGKEIEGLLDGHATVSIKRYSISSLYESTYSHYCDKCFLELGFDATERELRNRQQPKAEPKPAKEQFEVGDWVKYDIDSYLQVIEPSGKERTLCRTLSGRIVYPYTSCLTKVSPSEVVIQIGCLRGTVKRWDSTTFHMFHGNSKFSKMPFDALDNETRELVESLLKAQEEEK